MADTLDVLTLAEAQVGLNDTTADATELAVYNTAAARELDNYIGPVVIRTITDDVYDGGCPGLFLRDIHTAPFTVTAIKEYAGTNLTNLTAESVSSQVAGQWVVDDSVGGMIRRRDSGATTLFAAGTGNILISYTVGRAANTATVDPLYKLACKIILRKLWSGSGASAGYYAGTDGSQASGVPTFAMPNAVKDLVGRLHVPGCA